MKRNNSETNNIVYWTSGDSDDYLYGSSVTYSALDRVDFVNLLMPASFKIHAWQSTTNFQNDRTVPQLPPLKRGHHYHIEIDAQSRPEKTLYTQIFFYTIAREEIEMVTITGQQQDFVYPEKAFSYEIRLINAGLHELLFHEIRISEIQAQDAQTDPTDAASISSSSCLIASLTHADPQLHRLNLLFTEPSKNFFQQFDPDQLPVLKNLLVINDQRPYAGFYLADEDDSDYEENFRTYISSFCREHKFSAMNLIAYGPISSFAALYYHHAFAHAQAYISADYLSQSSDLKQYTRIGLKRQQHLSAIFANPDHRLRLDKDCHCYIPLANIEQSVDSFIQKTVFKQARLRKLPYTELNQDRSE
ncbi:MAG: accessory Sec system protein Asp3 [Oenococcus sp.]|uniref:accessory Sec system protein Asp3 n=1 Tax=Oenococcus sp. TaxID=1979414 RepID=UPI0039EA1C02